MAEEGTGNICKHMSKKPSSSGLTVDVIWKELKKGSDRECAVAGCALIDEKLAEVLSRRLIQGRVEDLMLSDLTEKKLHDPPFLANALRCSFRTP